MQPPHPPKQAARQTRRYNAVSKSCVSSESPSFFPMLIHRALRKRSHVRPVAHFAGFFLQIGNDVSPRTASGSAEATKRESSLAFSGLTERKKVYDSVIVSTSRVSGSLAKAGSTKKTTGISTF